jgi:dihydrodipicolinate reductase
MNMKIVVIGATGRTGENLVTTLRRDDLIIVEPSPTRGVNTITGEGLDEALHEQRSSSTCRTRPR